MTKNLQSAENMFSAYLNQDFDLMFGTADEAIRAFVQHGTPAKVSLVISDVEKVLSMRLSEEDLQKLILQELGSYYYFPAEWASGELWLRHVLDILRE